jgi:hypothetical protein
VEDVGGLFYRKMQDTANQTVVSQLQKLWKEVELAVASLGRFLFQSTMPAVLVLAGVKPL